MGVGTDNTIRPYRMGNACAESKGNKVKLRACKNNEPAQQWSYDAETGVIKGLHGGACWQASKSQGVGVITAPCNGAQNQKFLEDQGVLRRAGSVMCLQASANRKIKTKKCAFNMFAQESGSVVSEMEAPSALDIAVISVNGQTERNEFAEPWKTTSLSAAATFASGSAPSGSEYCWTIKFVENEGNAARPIRLNELENQCYKTNLLDFEFWYPGYYDVTVEVNGVAFKKQIRNLYARREVRDLTQEEWGRYVSAMWTIKNVKTSLGRTLYGANCPTGRPEDYHEHEYFVMVHTTLSANATSDQLHFQFFQEWAHQAWNTYLEQALQCVEPSVSMPYWNSVYDRTFHGGDGTDPSKMAESAVWSDQYYGGASNHANDDGSNPYYWVQDGVFANWWLSKKRDTALCDEIPSGHPDWQQRCRDTMGDIGNMWRNPDPTQSGFTAMEPSPVEKYQYVSRRPFYNYGNKEFFADVMPKAQEFQYVVYLENFVNAFRYITAVLHGTAHVLVSGRWNLQDLENAPFPDLPAEEMALLKNYTGSYETRTDLIKNLPYFGDGIFSVRNYEFCMGGRSRLDKCYECNDNGCFCVENPGCNDNDITTPSDSFDAQGTIKPGSVWSLWLSSCRGREIERNAKFGCLMAESGTFGISPFANQDPIFYPHHAFTYVMWDMLLQRIHKDADDPMMAPYYGFESGSALEMDGHNMEVVTNFMDLVPYKEGQTPGERQSWYDILDAWQFSKREYRWDINTPHGFAQISGFESLLANEHLYPGMTYEKNIDSSLETCSGVVNVKNLGPVPYTAELTPQCCQALGNHFAQIDDFGTGGGVLTDDLCAYEPTSLRCYAVAVPNYQSLASLDAVTGYDAMAIIDRLTNFCENFTDLERPDVESETRSGGKTKNPGHFLNFIYLNMCAAHEQDLCY